MALWFGTGPNFNLVGRALSVTLSPDSADANFPATYLYDGRPGTECRFSAISANEIVTCDLQAVLNGGFEGGFTATVPNFWTKTGAGATSDDTVNMRTGAHACKIDATAGTTYISQVMTAVPGEVWSMTAWVKTLAGIPLAKIYFYNRQTGHYLSAGVWGSTRNPHSNTGSGTYVQLGGSFTIEDVAACGNLPNVELEIQLEMTGSAGPVGVFDDVEAYPAVNFGGVFGHNLDPSIVPTLESSPDNSAWTVRATMDPRVRPVFYGFTSGTNLVRYWRMKFGGTQSTRSGAVSIGELVLAQLVQGLRNPGYPISTTWDELQQRNFSPIGAQWVYALSDSPVRTLALIIDTRGTMPSAQFKQLRDQLFRLSRNGLYPVVLIPQDTDPETCIYGRPSSTISYGQPFLTVMQINGLAIVEDALPTRVAS